MLMAFTFGFGLNDILGIYVVSNLLPYNEYILSVSRTVWYLLYIQAWEFAMKYLNSAMNSQAKPILSAK